MPFRRLAVAAAIAVALAGCANPYVDRPEQAVLRAPLPYAPPPVQEEPLPPVVFQPLPMPEPVYAPPALEEVQPDVPRLPVDVPPAAAEAPTPAEQVPPVATPAAVQAPAAEKGNVPLMGFRPMRGQKAPGA